MERRPVAVLSTRISDPSRIVFPVLLGTFVLISRVLCRGPLYFADGPEQVQSILEKNYIVQPPGYWLFDRIAGLFGNPVLAMQCMNILFSVAGVVAFYYVASFFTGRVNAFLAALAYATIFYMWFSGEIHSTYATQIFFPVGTYYLLLRYERDQKPWVVWSAAVVFSIGAGMRPTDGMFLIPLVLYFAIFRMPRRDRIVFLSLITLLCLGWLVPTLLAFERDPDRLNGFVRYISYITTTQSVLTGVRLYTLANPVRYLLPLLFAFWPLLVPAVRNAIRFHREPQVKPLILWIVPGSLFFVFCIIDDAQYLNFLSAAILLLAISVGEFGARRLVLTAVWNSFVFLALSPEPSRHLAVNIVNSFVLRTTHGAIEQRYSKKLSEIQHFAVE